MINDIETINKCRELLIENIVILEYNIDHYSNDTETSSYLKEELEEMKQHLENLNSIEKRLNDD